MKVAQAIIECLKAEAVEVVFGYPGAAVVPMYEEFRISNFNHILVRHEQAAGHCANGYARATGKTGVCIVTSGPGATNAITGIATAYMDSIPMVIITGQVHTSLIGKDAFQEADITGSTEPFTKHSYLVKKAEDVPRIIKEAFYIASTGRPGPVLVDIPVDIQEKEIDFEYPSDVSIRGYKPKFIGHKLQIKRVLEKIHNSKKPMICVGGGIALAGAIDEFRAFVEKSQIPVVHTLMGKDCLPSDSPYYVGFVGSHGFSASHKAISASDVVILIGTRLADRAISETHSFLRNKEIIHIDIDPAEIGKNLDALLPVVGDAKHILQHLTEGISPVNTDDWLKEIDSFNKHHKSLYKIDDTLNKVTAKYALNLFSHMVEDNAILVTDVGQNQIWSVRNYDIRNNMRFFTSGGLGTMGFGLPAAIGSKIGAPERRVSIVVGDGGFQMSLPELGTLVHTDASIIIILLNNSGLGMVRELQGGRYKGNFGVEMQKNPDFVKIAEAYGIKGRKVYKNSDLKAAFQEALDSKTSYLLELIVDPAEATLK